MRNESVEFCVARARGGDAGAFAELIRRCQRMVLAVAFAELGDAHLAGDVTQETFLRAWRKLPELREAAAFEGWVCGIARNLAGDYRRKRAIQRRTQDALPGAAPAKEAAAPDAALHAGERNQRIAAALARLDEITRAVVVLRYYENLPSKRIAELLSLSASAVDMRLSRARQELRERLSDLAEQKAGVQTGVASEESR